MKIKGKGRKESEILINMFQTLVTKNDGGGGNYIERTILADIPIVKIYLIFNIILHRVFKEVLELEKAIGPVRCHY